MLHRPCFMYRDDDGHDYFLFRENPLKPVGCLLSEKADQSFTQDEQMILDRRELEEMLDILCEAVFPKNRSSWTAWDSNVAMNRMRCILSGMTDVLEAIQKHPKDRKMDCFYLMVQVELALALALGGIKKTTFLAKQRMTSRAWIRNLLSVRLRNFTVGCASVRRKSTLFLPNSYFFCTITIDRRCDL